MIYVEHKYKGETPFKVNKRAFSISECTDDYTLQKSVDCTAEDDTNAHWADYSDTTILAGKQHDVECAANCWWRLKDNTGEFVVVY